MGRPKIQPAEMSYAEWVAKGHPPLALSCIQLAGWLDPPVSKQRVNQFVAGGYLLRDAKGKIHTDDTRNFLWLKGREGNAPPPRPPGRPAYRHLQTAPPAPAVWSPDASTDQLDLQVMLDAIGQLDLNGLSTAAVQKVQRLESALKTRVERDAKRGQLIDRTLVATVFSRLYQIESNELRSLGAKLSPDIAGDLGVEDPAVQLAVEKRIDGEILKVMAHIKRLLNDFLVRVGAGELGV